MADFKSAIYGWSIVWQPEPEARWVVDDNEDANGLPAIYEDWQMAMDRLSYLESKTVKARMVAVLVHPADFQIDGTNKYDRSLGTPVSGWWPHSTRKKSKEKDGDDSK